MSPGSLGQYTLTVLAGNRRIGDSNLDGIFNSTDLIVVFQAGEYEDGIANNSSWGTGDWNGDGEFDTADLVYAFQAGTYSRAAKVLPDKNDQVFAALELDTTKSDQAPHLWKLGENMTHRRNWQINLTAENQRAAFVRESRRVDSVFRAMDFNGRLSPSMESLIDNLAIVEGRTLIVKFGRS